MSEERIQKKHATVRRPFTIEEDARLMEIMNNQEFLSWDHVASLMCGRTTRQCRERWVNYLSPDIRNDPWTEDEDELLLSKINEIGRCWSNIGKFFNGRSENDVKNRWYSHLKYRIKMNDDGKYEFVASQTESLYPNRKKRNRTKISPQKNALKILEQKRRAQAMYLPQYAQFAPFYAQQMVQQMPQQIPQPTQQPQQIPPPTFVDYWDRSLLDEYADAIMDPLNLTLSAGFGFE